MTKRTVCTAILPLALTFAFPAFANDDATAKPAATQEKHEKHCACQDKGKTCKCAKKHAKNCKCGMHHEEKTSS